MVMIPRRLLPVLLLGLIATATLLLLPPDAEANRRRRDRQTQDSGMTLQVERYLNEADQFDGRQMYGLARDLRDMAIVLLADKDTPERFLRLRWRAYTQRGAVDQALDLYDSAPEALQVEWEAEREGLENDYGLVQIILSAEARGDVTLEVAQVRLTPRANAQCGRPPRLHVKEDFERLLLEALSVSRQQSTPVYLPRGSYDLEIGLKATGSGLDYVSPVLTVEVESKPPNLARVQVPFEQRPKGILAYLLSAACLLVPLVL